MKRVAVVQARMGSTRLPGKVLRDLAGRPVLTHVIRRLKAATSLDDIVVATSVAEADDAIVQLAGHEDVRVFRGSEGDVLARTADAARSTNADVVVRITADCPLIDPAVADLVVDTLVESDPPADYASNVLLRTYPRGLDVEAMFMDTLQRVARLARTASAREHVTVLIRSEMPELFVTRSVENGRDDSDLRWTVDEERDLAALTRIFIDLGLSDRPLPFEMVVDHVRKHPEMAALNADVRTWTPSPEHRQQSGEEVPR